MNTAKYLDRRWQYQASHTHATAEAFRRRQEQRQRDADKVRAAANDEQRMCPFCRGKGEVWKKVYGGETWQEPCAECNGTGNS
jgi:DnaJ-class molecular chaperone